MSHRDGVRMARGRNTRLGSGWGWACWQVSVVSSSRLLRGNESRLQSVSEWTNV